MVSYNADDDNNKNDGPDSVTFDYALDTIGTGFFQYKMILIGGLVILSSYVTSHAIAFVLSAAQCDLNMNSEDKGRLTSVFFVGLVLTCHMWGFLSDTMGRRYILLRCLFVDGILYFLTVLTSNYYLILLLRFVNGIASSGGSVAIYAYVGEFQTNSFRSISLLTAAFIGSLAYSVMPSIAWLIIPAKWHFTLYSGHSMRPWKLFYALCGVPSLFSTILLYFMPESPKFLLAKEKNDKAMEVLKRMYRENHKNAEMYQIKNVQLNEMEKVAKIDDNQNKVSTVFKLVWRQTAPLFKKPLRNNFILLLVAFFASIYCNNGLYVWLPQAINQIESYKHETGCEEGTFCDIMQHKNHFRLEHHNKYLYNGSSMDLMNANMTQIKDGINKIDEEEICNDDVDTSVYLIYLIVGICLTISSIAITIINKFVNKKYLMIVLAMSSLSFFISMKIPHALITVPIKACIVMVSGGCVFPILNSIVVDLFPTNLRAMAGCLTMLTCRFGSIVVHTVSGILIETNCNLLLWSYISLTIALLLSIIFLPAKAPDTSSQKQRVENNDGLV